MPLLSLLHIAKSPPKVVNSIYNTDCTNSALACVDVRKMWIRLRRIIALAELIGLPRASKTLSAEATPHHKSAAAIWESICVVDRLSGMMFNLPSATKSFPPLHASVMLDNGSVNVQAYISRLTEIALNVQDLDNTPSSEKPGVDQLAKVFAVDERLRDRELGILDALTAHGVDVRLPAEAARRRWLGKFYYRPPGGEAWTDVALRLRSFLRDAAQAADGAGADLLAAIAATFG